jgi:hypothetical protein
MNQRQRDLHAAVLSAAKDKQTQLELLTTYARRHGASERDRKVVERAIIGGPVVECAG